MLATDNNLVPSPLEGSGTFCMAPWNIINGRGVHLTQAAAGLVQMRIKFAVLTETKIVNGRHPKTASGYTSMCAEAMTGHQGGVGLLWMEDDPKYNVESVLFQNGPNIVTFQVVVGDKQYYIIGVYIFPSCTEGVNSLWQALEECLAGFKPIVMGDLNVSYGFP